MLHYGGLSPKRHYMLANTKHKAGLWVSKLRNWAQKKKELEKQGKYAQLVTKYVDKKGKRRYKGSAKLRSSESWT